MSGGASFTPRVYPRPVYPPFREVFGKEAVTLLRGPMIAAVLAVLAEPLWRTAVHAFEDAVCVRGSPVVAIFQRLDPALATQLERRIDVENGNFVCEQAFFTFGFNLVHSLCYLLINSFFHLCDVFKLLQRHKCLRTEIQAAPASLLNRCWGDALLGQCVTGPLLTWFLLYPLAKYCGMASAHAPFPGLLKLYIGFGVCRLFNDVGFYWSHRIAHAKALYRFVHKKHHTFVGTVGFAAEFAHPIEQVFSNYLPTIGGSLLFGQHMYVHFQWLAERLEQTYEGHSGYSFHDTIAYKWFGLTWADACCYHDFHHTGNCGNFGAAYLDWTFGTMDSYIALGGREGYFAKCRKNDVGVRESKMA